MIGRIVVAGVAGIASCFACSAVEDLSKKPGSEPLYRIVREGKHGYMDRGGRIVIQPRFDAARDFFHGLAAVFVKGRAGYVDRQGRLAIATQFDDAKDFLEELAPVRIGRLWGYVDRRGQVVIQPRFQGAAEFHEGLARIYVWNTITLPIGPQRQQFTKDTARLFAFEPPFEDPCESWTGDDGRFGFIDKTGRIVIPPRFENAEHFSEGFAAVCLEGCRGGATRRFGFVDRDGNVAGPHYEFADTFSEGLARIRVRDKYGFIDRTGRIAIAPQYEFAGDFHNGLARVERQNKWGYIDRTGKVSIPFQFRSAWDFAEGVAVACSDVCVYIDRAGKQTVPNVFFKGTLWNFSGGLALVSEDALFTFRGLLTRLKNYYQNQLSGAVYIDTSANVVGFYATERK